jgi:hypothetical protein
MPCAKTHQPLEGLEGLENLEGLEDLEDPEDQEHLKDPLQQYLQQTQQEETRTTGLWETFPRYSTEIERMPETSSTPYSATSEQMPESPALIHPYAKYPSCSHSSKDLK